MPATGWSYLMNSGDVSVSNDYIEETAIAISSGTPFIATMITGSVTVRKYASANTWTTVGAAPLAENAFKIKLAVASDGTLYIAYDNADNTNQVQVMKFQ